MLTLRKEDCFSGNLRDYLTSFVKSPYTHIRMMCSLYVQKRTCNTMKDLSVRIHWFSLYDAKIRTYTRVLQTSTFNTHLYDIVSSPQEI